MTNIEIVKTLIKVMEPASVTDEAIKQAVLALLDQEKPKKEAAAKSTSAKKPGRKAKPFDIGKAKACRTAGWSIAKIADEMSCSEPTVKKYLAEAGYAIGERYEQSKVSCQRNHIRFTWQ